MSRDEQLQITRDSKNDEFDVVIQFLTTLIHPVQEITSIEDEDATIKNNRVIVDCKTSFYEDNKNQGTDHHTVVTPDTKADGHYLHASLPVFLSALEGTKNMHGNHLSLGSTAFTPEIEA